MLKPMRLVRRTIYRRLGRVFYAAAGLLILAITGNFCAHAQPDPVPWGRGMHWNPNVVGVQGGIPARTVFTNMNNLDARGQTDVSAAINNAINLCPSNQVVQIPAGTFLLNKSVIIPPTKHNVTLRGKGAATVFLSKPGNIHGGMSPWPVPGLNVQIRGGAGAGSTTIDVANSAGAVVGGLICIGQRNPAYVHSVAGETNCASSMHLISSVTPTGITFWPPLVMTLTNQPVCAFYALQPMTGVGLEDFAMNLSYGTAPCGVYMETCWGCWVKNVEIFGANSRQMMLYCFNAGEVRDCYTHDVRASGPNHEGIDFYRDGCWNLIENNTIEKGGFPGIILGDYKGGCWGNVVAYNSVNGIDSGSSVAGAAISVNHGPHNSFNLFEGNVAQMFQSDGYYGSASHNTLFRNFFTGAYPNNFDWPRAVDLCRWSYYFNLIGNVLGTNDRAFTYTSEMSGFSGPLIFRLGYPNMGNMGFSGTNPPNADARALDCNVKNTAFMLNNYDYATRKVDRPGANIPASLFYTNRPAWWTPGLRWPPIGPELSPMVSPIPAQMRATRSR